jgi:hypothetical protein
MWCLVAGSALLFAGACTPGEPEARTWEELAEKACACAGNACAKAALDELKASRKKLGSKPLAAEYARRVEAASTKATTCLISRGVPPESID